MPPSFDNATGYATTFDVLHRQHPDAAVEHEPPSAFVLRNLGEESLRELYASRGSREGEDTYRHQDAESSLYGETAALGPGGANGAATAATDDPTLASPLSNLSDGQRGLVAESGGRAR